MQGSGARRDGMLPGKAQLCRSQFSETAMYVEAAEHRRRTVRSKQPCMWRLHSTAGAPINGQCALTVSCGGRRHWQRLRELMRGGALYARRSSVEKVQSQVCCHCMLASTLSQRLRVEGNCLSAERLNSVRRRWRKQREIASGGAKVHVW